MKRIGFLSFKKTSKIILHGFKNIINEEIEVYNTLQLHYMKTYNNEGPLRMERPT
jgi:hypothetical protein